VLITPLLGVLVPNLAGLIDHARHTPAGLAASYAWFIFVAFLTWEGNLRLYLRFQDRSAWLTRPWHRVRLLIGLICLFTVPFCSLTLGGWSLVTADPAATPRSLGVAVLLVVSAVVFITHVYETVFLVRDWESDRMRGERLQREKVEAELDGLRSDVDPHALYNSLNALSHLIETGSPRTGAFVDALADSHRYLVRARSKRLVTVAEELSLLDQFVTLTAIRYPDALNVSVQVDPDAAQQWLMPPVTLPELLQNAAKHNEITAERPLAVVVRLEGDRLLVCNERRPRAGVVSTGVGLENLARRFRLLCGTPARWGVNGAEFIVVLPLVRS